MVRRCSVVQTVQCVRVQECAEAAAAAVQCARDMCENGAGSAECAVCRREVHAGGTSECATLYFHAFIRDIFSGVPRTYRCRLLSHLPIRGGKRQAGEVRQAAGAAEPAVPEGEAGGSEVSEVQECRRGAPTQKR